MFDLVGDLRRWRVGLEVHQHRGETRTGDTVEQAVVVLHHRSGPVVRESVDEPHLPQRMTAIELAAEDLSGERCEFLESSGGGNLDVEHMAVDVEVVVVDPHGAIEPERDLLQLPHELRRQRQPLEQRLAHRQERILRCLGAVENGQPTDVLVPVRLFHGEEHRIGTAQPLHATQTTHRAVSQPKGGRFFGGRWGTRTLDLCRVKTQQTAQPVRFRAIEYRPVQPERSCPCSRWDAGWDGPCAATATRRVRGPTRRGETRGRATPFRP